MTGPDGDSHGAPAVDPPISLEFSDAFTDADGTPVADMPVNTVTVQTDRARRRNSGEVRSALESRKDMERWVSTGTREGCNRQSPKMDVLLGPERGMSFRESRSSSS